MKNKTLCIFMAMFIALGVACAVLYGSMFLKTQGVYLYLGISLIGVLESIATTTALVLYLKGKKGKLANVIYLASIVLCIPVARRALSWYALLVLRLLGLVLHLLGIDMLPPSQR